MWPMTEAAKTFQEESGYEWLGDLGLLGWAAVVVVLAVSVFVPLWYRTAGACAPLVAAMLWGGTLGIAVVLILVDLGHAANLSRYPPLTAFLAAMWVLIIGAGYLHFRRERRRRG